MDPVTTTAALGSLDKFGAREGFAAVMCLILIAAVVVIVRAFLGFLKEERSAAREERTAHVGVLTALTGKVEQVGQSLGLIGEGVRDIKTELTVRRRAGGE